jgi:site-specific recombinase XerD
MFQVILKSEFARRRHRDAPFLEERTRHLQHCAECGATIGTLRVKSNELLWTARLLPPDAAAGVDFGALQEIVRRRMAIHESKTTSYRLIAVARPWLRYLGWWRGPIETVPFRRELDQYVEWMRSERGLTPCTVAQWRFRVLEFLKWRDAAGGQLSDLAPTDIDRYLIEGAVRWCRVSSAYIGCALRAFFRFAGAQGWCSIRLASTIHGPRIYEHESLPKGPSWSDVKRLIAAADTDKPKDIRDRAILTGHFWCYQSVVTLFQHVRRSAGIDRPAGEPRPPRLHDLRHTAAVHRVVAWYRSGKDVQRLLPQLATYLGHANILSTQRYLQMTPELLYEASRRFAHYAEPGGQP